ncbi:unnamed protein product [Prorocentrum cordatum]|uniref:Uncharacterized protein n=1 Tax=Prorocentrum cordatum TaxID=2364126 RepID=A0ABN9VXS1_9DINO|nr:unnamed protein product [Polarella glacialis]
MGPPLSWTTPPGTPRARARVPDSPPPLLRPSRVPFRPPLELHGPGRARGTDGAALRAPDRAGRGHDAARSPTETGAERGATGAEGQPAHRRVSSAGGAEIFSAPPVELRGMPGFADWTEWLRWSTAQFELGVAPPPPWELQGTPRRW